MFPNREKYAYANVSLCKYSPAAFPHTLRQSEAWTPVLCSKISCKTKSDWFIWEHELAGTNQNFSNIWRSLANSREILIVLMSKGLSALGFDADFLIFPPSRDFPRLYLLHTSTEIRRRSSKGCCNRPIRGFAWPCGEVLHSWWSWLVIAIFLENVKANANFRCYGDRESG